MPGSKASPEKAGSSPRDATSNGTGVDEAALHELLRALRAAKDGDFSVRLPERRNTLLGQIGAAYNDLVALNATATKELGRVARLVGREGRMNERFSLDARGAWADTSSSVNRLIEDLSRPTTEVARVIEAVAQGDLSQKMALKIEGQPVKGEFLRIGTTVNAMVDQLSSFSAEVSRVAREVGTDGKLGGQAKVKGVSGTWNDLTENVNSMASNLTGQVRNIAQVTTAVARGDLTQKITVEARGEVLQLKETINTMVGQLSSFADEVTRVAREVGTEGKLGGQADVKGVSGTWKDLTDNVNYMASNLTSQVRNIAQVATAVARGDLSQKITVEAKGEVAVLADTINSMTDTLRAFADEVTRVAREVGTEGKLGGQAEVKGVSGTWGDLTGNVNIMAGSLTTQVRAIAEVATAVTQGDLTRSIAVEAQGEVAELKDNINQMIGNLAETTRRNEEQDWLKTNLARISSLMQGQRDLQTVSRLIMSELTPTVSAQHGAFFLNDVAPDADTELRLVASYGYKARKNVPNSFKLGESLVGQAALEKEPILITEAPADYVKVSSGLGEAAPVNVIVLPILFEEQVLGVIELGALRPFTAVNQSFLEQVIETIGVVLSTIIANTRTEELLSESQRLAQELQSQQEELRRSNAELESQAASLKASEELLQQQQEELQQTNEELQEKARLLAEQNRSIEVKNREIEMARLGLEEKAQQLALSSKYKSEFLANMSHELRTPLNSLLILAKLLADNPEGNLDAKQVEFATTIHTAGSDLLELINDILDLSKVEAGKMDVVIADVGLAELCATVEQSFRPVADEKQLEFTLVREPGAPELVVTDEQRLHQVLRNLLSNAFKFTEVGCVRLCIGPAPADMRYANPVLTEARRVVAFSVTDTGIGIPSDKLRLVFEAFQQADGTTSRRYGGTGLGLSISREIARLLGGEIRATSVVGEGSTFTLFLPEVYVPPVEVPDEAGPPLPAGPSPGAAHPAPAAADPDRLAAMEIGPGDIPDDRATAGDGDRVLLAIVGEEEVARQLLELGHERGFKVVLASRGGAGLALATDVRPDAIVVDAEVSYAEGDALLAHFKRDAAVRHIPVHVLGAADSRWRTLRSGAFGFSAKPADRAELAALVDGLATWLEAGEHHLLVVEDDDTERQAVVALLATGPRTAITAVGSSEEAVAVLDRQAVDCVVLDLKLPRMSGFALLERIKSDERFARLPVIVYTGKDLTRREELRLSKFAESIIVKDARSPERLLEEVTLFLHQPGSQLPDDQRLMLEQLHSHESLLNGKRVLIVDDDVRNVFALTSVLERHGMTVVFAENGTDGIALLEQTPDVDLVLMDIMMPEMDGYETTAAIRKNPRFKKLPIIALTAKAMRGDREKSIAAGASDYITKPVDVDQLLSLIRVWLYA
ncbi:MAG: response regulator [Actinomycetota bacterium]